MTQHTLKFQPKIAFDDPVVIAIDLNIDRSNRKIACKKVAKMHKATIKKLRDRVIEMRKSPAELAIVIANVEDDNGGDIAEMLMPGHDWGKALEKDKAVFAIGLADRKAIEHVIRFIDEEAADRLSVAFSTRVIVVDYGVAEIC